jgi:hypothetical protein
MEPKNKKGFNQIFKDDNTYNEKNIVGFLSFTILVIFALTDIVTGIFGNKLEVSDTIFMAFVGITLGSFGIDGITKIFKK